MLLIHLQYEKLFSINFSPKNQIEENELEEIIIQFIKT